MKSNTTTSALGDSHSAPPTLGLGEQAPRSPRSCSCHERILHWCTVGAQPEQSTATARAAQISRMRASATRPNRWTRMVIETLSIESRFTAERSGTGSSPGSSTTSLASPRMVVVQGATSARRCRGMTTSRDKTTTGRRPISAISHHQTSPRAGRAVTTLQPHFGTTPGRPTRPARRADARRRRRSSHPPGLSGTEPAERRELRPRSLRLSPQTAPFGHPRGAPRQPWCSNVCEPCHHHAMHARRQEESRQRIDSGHRPRPVESSSRPTARCRSEPASNQPTGFCDGPERSGDRWRVRPSR